MGHRYLADRRPHWGEGHDEDHGQLARAGGEAVQCGTHGWGAAIDGPLHPLMAMHPQDLTTPSIAAWATNGAKTRSSREAQGKTGVKQDALLHERLPTWFAAARVVGHSALSSYLQTLLLTDARAGDWKDTNTQWRG